MFIRTWVIVSGIRSDVTDNADVLENSIMSHINVNNAI